MMQQAYLQSLVLIGSMGHRIWPIDYDPYSHHFANHEVNLNILTDAEYNTLAEIISKLEREEKLLMMSVDEREKFFNDEIEALKAQEKAALEAAKEAEQPLPTVKEETQLENQPETGNESAGDVVSSNVDGDVTNEIAEPIAEVDEGNVDGPAPSQEGLQADTDATEGAQAVTDDAEKVDDEKDAVDEEKTVDMN